MLDNEILNKYMTNYDNDKHNKIMERIVNRSSLINIIQDNDSYINEEFNINVDTHGVTDQSSSGRCWIYAGLNALREKIISECNLSNFELSANYIAYYDKLERFYNSMEQIILYNKNGLYDRYLSCILSQGMFDGGFFTQLANLTQKYGIVPANVYNETYSSSNTYEINQILSRLLRKFYLDINKDNANIEKIKDSYMEIAYKIITNVYGTVPKSFDFEYTDRDGNYHIDKELTPKSFYDKYIGIDLVNDYVEIASYNDNIINYNNVYQEEDSSMISGASDNVVLNLESDDFIDLIVKQLKDNKPVYFYCSTTSKRIDGTWIDLMERYGDLFDVDLKLDQNSILMTNGITNCHCMIITGINEVDNKINRWKIENSWGANYGNNGYYVASNEWINTYVHRIVIDKKYLSKEQLKLLDNKKIKIKKFENKF